MTSQAVVVVHWRLRGRSPGREILGTATGDSDRETFWAEFPRGPRGRPASVQLVLSNTHRGLRTAYQDW